jgi:hypothetical protein
MYRFSGWGDIYRAAVGNLGRRADNEARPLRCSQMSSPDLAKMLLACGGHMSLAFGIFFRALPDTLYWWEGEALRQEDISHGSSVEQQINPE